MEAKKKTGGREKNTPNKTTAEAKQLFKEILASQGLHVEQSLNKLREESNEKFLNCFTKLVGFYMPKMSESQNTIDNYPYLSNWSICIIDIYCPPPEHLHA